MRLFVAGMLVVAGLASMPAVAQISPLTGSAEGPLGGAAPAPPVTPRAARGSRAAQRFATANTTHDGKLTKDQAQAAHMRYVTQHFDEIDTDHKGYVTMDDIRTYRRTQAAAHRAHRTPTVQ